MYARLVRFRAAKEAIEHYKDLESKGENLPEGPRFDSNCITPGTEFMDRLQTYLRYFIQKKLSTDALWARVEVVLTGHNVAGEGEHKIMDYIRWCRSQPNHAPNTRHCVHGLDADLIMLGLITHEPHFSILREDIKLVCTYLRIET